jgi:DNA methyltransferase 1-associated protein 1
MGDIADILGLSSNNNHKDGLSQEASKILGTSESMKSKNSSKLVKKPKGMSREVFSLLGQDNLTSSLQPQLTIQQSNTFKSKRSAISSGKWVWSEVFESSSNRTRNYPKIYHWMKSDLQNIEYPYLKFDVQLDRVTFTHEEYETLLRSEKWTESESEYLLDLCYTYELRWPVILDRYSLQPPRRTEELQHRFYSILSSLQSYRGSSSLGRGESFTHFNIEVERNRRIQQELVFYK